MGKALFGTTARRLGLAAMAVLAIAAAGACRRSGAAGGDRASGAPPASDLAFRNAVDQAPDKHGFVLSADYPTALPAACGAKCPWLAMDVDFDAKFPPPAGDRWSGDKGWGRYLGAILDYVREGQDPNLADAVGFKSSVGGATRWYNVPWMAYDPQVGREWRHGTTNERTAHLQDLVGPNGKPLPEGAKSLGAVHLFGGMSDQCAKQYPQGFETWSVGYYNPQGGYALGRSIPRDGVPKVQDYLGSPMPAGLPFPGGTVVMKVLTTNAPPECVKFLQGAPEWKVNRHVFGTPPGTGPTPNPSPKYLCAPALQVSRVVQIDVAVTDPRSPTGWVYGTFAYDGQRPGATFWDRLVPLGVQWGADPWSFPAVPEGSSKPLQQTVANPDVSRDKLYEHMGCGGRLAGPVDNPGSSCMSCHGSAYAAKVGARSVMGTNVPASFGFDALCQAYSVDNANYFQNSKAPQSFAGGRYPGAMPLDTSLQLEVALQQYGIYASQGHPDACKDPQ